MIDKVDVHDLPEKDAEVIQKLAELMRERIKKEATKETSRERIKLPTYRLGVVKGNLSRRDIYDYL